MAASIGSSPPWELVEAQVCEMLHKFPEELRAQPTDSLIRMLRLLGVYYEWYNPKNHEKAQSFDTLSS